MSSLVVDDIGLLVTNDEALGEGPLGLVRNAALVIEDGARRRDRARRRGRRRADRRGRPLRDPGVRRLAHAPRVRRRPRRRVRRADGGRAVRRGRHPRHHRRDPRRHGRGPADLTSKRAGRGAAAPASPTSRSSRATGSTSRPSGAAARSPAALHRRRHLPRRPRRARGHRRRRLRRARHRRHARRLRAARPLDRRLLRGGRVHADQSRAVLEAGRAAGLGLRVHGNQLGPGPGVQLAVELGAASVDHCTYLTDDDVDALAGSDTVATFLPATDFSTRQPYPDARRVIDAGADVAIATNCNPGSSYTTSMAFCLALAVRDMRMTTEEALLAATQGRRAGAAALRHRPPRPGRPRRPRDPRRPVVLAPRLPPGGAARRAHPGRWTMRIFGDHEPRTIEQLAALRRRRGRQHRRALRGRPRRLLAADRRRRRLPRAPQPVRASATTSAAATRPC